MVPHQLCNPGHTAVQYILQAAQCHLDPLCSFADVYSQLLLAMC